LDGIEGRATAIPTGNFVSNRGEKRPAGNGKKKGLKAGKLASHTKKWREFFVNSMSERVPPTDSDLRTVGGKWG